MADATMAKKRGRPKGEVPPDRKGMITSLRGTEAYAVWFDRFCRHSDRPPTVMIERALRLLAEREGFDSPPARLGEDGA